MYNFFAYLSRMKYIERWNLMRSTSKENIMEHSELVALIAHALALINNKYCGGSVDPAKTALLGMYHEAAEVLTGDLPAPIKYYNPEISKAYKDIEKIAEIKLLAMLPPELKTDYAALIAPDTSEEEYMLVKAADKIAAYIKCVEELKCGNTEFSKAKKSLEREITAIPLPEVKYFMDNFGGSFLKTLDELE